MRRLGPAFHEASFCGFAGSSLTDMAFFGHLEAERAVCISVATHASNKL